MTSTTAPEKSTIGRTTRSARHASIKTAVRTLDAVAPALATRWASRIWCTPPHPRRRPAPATPGARFTVPLAADPRSAPRTVVAETWGEAGGPITYLLHGWGGWRWQLAGFVEPLVSAGHQVVALDAPGHGESGAGRLGGRRSYPLEFAEALTAVMAATGPAHAIVGHSAGAAAAAIAVHDGLPTGKLAFVAPMADPMPYITTFTDTIGLGERSGRRMVRRLEKLVGRKMEELDLPRRAGQAGTDKLPPLLVVHDRADRVIRYADSQALAAAWHDATLHTTEGLGHRRILADPGVIDATVSFVTGHRESDRQHPA